MTIKITYEWAIEYRDEHGDIEEIDHFNITKDAVTAFAANKGPADLVLVCDTWETIQENLEDRQWAYVEDGKLPKTFSGSAKVPQRFHKQLAATKENNGEPS